MSNRADIFDDEFDVENFFNEKPAHKGTAKHIESKQKRNRARVIRVITADVLLVGIGLVIFALFHHVLPRGSQTAAVKLPQSTVQSAVSSLAPSSTATASAAAKPSAAQQAGEWGEKFADKFTSGDVQKTENSYKSQNLNITVEKVQNSGITYFFADIYIRNLENFKTAFAAGKYSTGVNAPALDIANKNNAVLAITGDYFGIRQDGIVIRNGELYRDTLFEDVLIMNNDGSMETMAASQFDIEKIKKNGAYQGWSFGPMLLTDGKAMQTFNSTVNPANPRSAIGYYEPGHYCFVLVDGRQPGYSDGMTLKQLSQLFYDRGCKVAYNLDGGQSAQMIFMGKVISQPYNGGRDVSDILYLTEK